jgi:DNA primase
MPEGADPADLIGAEGADAFTRRLDAARVVPDYEARRVVRQSDLRTPDRRDQALERVRPLVQQLPANSATRDELVAFLADRLDVPVEYVEAQRPAPSRDATPAPRPSAPAPRPAEAVARAERDFLAMCLAAEKAGREYLDRADDALFTSDVMRMVRRHLLANFEDPLGALPDDDPALAAVVTEVAMRGQEQASSLHALRLTFLQLELRKLDRQVRHAHRDGDFQRQRALLPERESVKEQIHDLMGQTT